MSDDSDEIEKTINTTDGQNSSNVEARSDWENETRASLALYEAIQDIRQQIDAGEISSNLTFRDLHMSALIRGLEETEQLANVAAEAEATLNRDSDNRPVNRAEALRLLFRVGLQEVAPETIQIAVEANKDHLLDQMDDF